MIPEDVPTGRTHEAVQLKWESLAQSVSKLVVQAMPVPAKGGDAFAAGFDSTAAGGGKQAVVANPAEASEWTLTGTRSVTSMVLSA